MTVESVDNGNKRNPQKVWKTGNYSWIQKRVKIKDIQNVEINLVLVGCDMEALYPSLDVEG